MNAIKKGNIPNQQTSGELRDGEYHPAAESALVWFKEWQLKDLNRYLIVKESIASTALSGNRLAEILSETLQRLDEGKPVSDRYLLGLCWFLKEDYESQKEN